MHKPVLGAVVLVAIVVSSLLGCAPSSPPPPTEPPCPQATPELLQVDPVTPHTDLLSQAVTVHMGNCEVVTITAESGVFTSACYPAQVEVALLPDRAHHLEVVARVREIWRGDCRYGGYTLRTRRDREGGLLIIEQGQPAPPAAPGAAIRPENVAHLAPLLALAPEARLATDFCFGPGDEMVSVGYEDQIRRWSLSRGEEIGRMGEQPESSALRVAASPDGSLIATGGTADDPAVRLWQGASGEMRELGRHESHPESLAFSPSGSLLASGDNQNRVRVWNVADGQPVTFFEGDVPKRHQLFHSLYWPDEETLIGAGADAIYWWDVTSGQLLERLARPDEAAFFVGAAFEEGGNRLAAVAQDENLYVWEGEAAGWAMWPARPGDSLRQVAFSPDGRLLAAGTSEGEVLFWDAETGELVASHSISSRDMAAVRFSPDGRILAAGGWDSPIWLWGVP